MNKQLIVLLLVCILLSNIVFAEIIVKKKTTRNNIFNAKSNRLDLKTSSYAQTQNIITKPIFDKSSLQKKTGLKAGRFESGKGFAKGPRIALRKIETRKP